jgi:uracil-DNA glycosylase
LGLDSAADWETDPAMALDLLAWQVEMGVTDALDEGPVDCFALSAADLAARPAPAPPVAPPVAPRVAPRVAPIPARAAAPPAEAADLIAQATALAEGAGDLDALAQALAGFDGCELKRGARSCVFADGNPAARVMIVGEGPGREEDRSGLPFVGPAGQMLDRMFAAIDMGRAQPDPSRALYITNTVPWRPPGNRTPTDDEIALMRPFLLRHIALADPAVLVLMGNAACQAMLGRQGISRLRGTWAQALGRPVLPMFHPSALLNRPDWKREAWADLLSLQAKLRELP